MKAIENAKDLDQDNHVKIITKEYNLAVKALIEKNPDKEGLLSYYCDESMIAQKLEKDIEKLKERQAQKP